jgi:hypothetical protein
MLRATGPLRPARGRLKWAVEHSIAIDKIAVEGSGYRSDIGTPSMKVSNLKKSDAIYQGASASQSGMTCR